MNLRQHAFQQGVAGATRLAVFVPRNAYGIWLENYSRGRGTTMQPRRPQAARTLPAPRPERGVALAPAC